MKSDFLIALTQLAAERGLPREMVLSAVEAALASAYKKDNIVSGQNVTVRLNPGSGDFRVYVLMNVVEIVEDPRKEISLKEAKKHNSDTFIGDTIEIEGTPYLTGRIAAQNARQVVMQRLREAERELVFEEYSHRSEEIVTGTIQRIEPRQVTVDLGRTEAIMPEEEQVSTERYRPGQKMKFFITEVVRSAKGPEIIISRSQRGLIKRLFEIEVPEIYNGIVEIKSVAREAGSRSKVAVWARQPKVDAVGSCVGLRGIRIQNIVNELQGEKIDVVQWDEDPAVFIGNALNPSQALHVEIDEAERSAKVVVQDKQLSLAIGKEGQNVRLVAKLTEWKIDILSSSESELERSGRVQAPAPKIELKGDDTNIQVEAAAISNEKDEQLDVVESDVAVSEIADDAKIQTDVAEEAISSDSGDQVVADDIDVSESPSIEELAVLSLQEEPTVVEDDSGSPDEVEVSLTDDVWKVPELIPSATGSQIRFAEDIMSDRPGESDRRGRKSRGGNQGAAGKGKRNKSSKK